MRIDQLESEIHSQPIPSLSHALVCQARPMSPPPPVAGDSLYLSRRTRMRTVDGELLRAGWLLSGEGEREI